MFDSRISVRSIFPAFLLPAAVILLLGACGSADDAVEADDASGAGPATPVAQADTGWQTQIQQRRSQIDQTIERNPQAFAAFDTGSLGDATLEMIPWVVFRVLQDLEPSVFSDAALKSFGFFERSDVATGLNGIVWTRPVPPVDPQFGSFELRYFTRTCASCHTGRVRTGDGQIRVLHGGANTENRLHYFVGQLTQALKARLGESGESPEYAQFRQAIVSALEAQDAGFYWGPEMVAPAEVEKEVATVTENLDAVLAQMRVMNDHRLKTLGLLQKYSYDKVPNPPSLTAGAPGIIETAGLGAAAVLAAVGEDKASLVLPPGPSKADIPAVWRLDPTGLANWDATVKGFSRALTSSLAVVGDLKKVNLEANKEIQSFLGELPPEPFPGPLDLAAIERGEDIYQANCLACHSPAPGRSRNEMVFEVNSDPARGLATSSMAAQILQKIVTSVCPDDQECQIIDPADNRGYSAESLAGIWMQAPYLHNGSVPTLRQLLVPSLRTSEPFLRGSIHYDFENGGWEWDPDKEQSLRAAGDVAIALHDLNEAGMGNYGHGSVEDQYLTVDGARLRVAWTEDESDRQVVDDLIAYMLSL